MSSANLNIGTKKEAEIEEESPSFEEMVREVTDHLSHLELLMGLKRANTLHLHDTARCAFTIGCQLMDLRLKLKTKGLLQTARGISVEKVIEDITKRMQELCRD